MKNRRNYYRILNVQPDAPPEVIRSSYRTMMQRMRMHPDLGGDSGAAAVINEAYRTLIDEQQRRLYDLEHRDRAWAWHRRRTGDDQRVAPGDAARQCPFCCFRHVSADFPEPPGRCVNCRSPLDLLPAVARDARDRRCVTRLPRAFDLMFYTHWPQAAHAVARALDFSPAGMRFDCAAALAAGQVLKVESQPLDAVLCVARSTRRGDRWEVGARFLSVCFARRCGTFVACRA